MKFLWRRRGKVLSQPSILCLRPWVSARTQEPRPFDPEVLLQPSPPDDRGGHMISVHLDDDASQEQAKQFIAQFCRLFVPPRAQVRQKGLHGCHLRRREDPAHG
jgi:hypothetical protein